MDCIDPFIQFLENLQWGFGGAFAMMVFLVVYYSGGPKKK